ncbi:MAG: tetratricopeptide repeat protein [Pseudomonadota bacterium]
MNLIFRYKKEALILILILLLTSFAFSPSLKGEFLVSWDDNTLITQNVDIQKLNMENIQNIFSKSYVGMYIPLVILSFAIEYHFVKYNPYIFHLTNLLFHLLNIVLVFLLITMLFSLYEKVYIKKLQYKLIIASLVTFLFAIHPMHVESVVWISERKDLMFTFFFLFSTCAYLKHLSISTIGAKFYANKYYILSLLFFILALFCKAQAVTLPIVLLLIDYLLSNKISLKNVFFEKILFFLLALVFGIIAILSQLNAGIFSTCKDFNFLNKLFFIIYSFIQYILKLALPFNLSAFYQYPKLNSFTYFLYLLLFLFILSALIYLYSKKYKLLIFSGLFFLINISIVLQTRGAKVFMADRFVYLPCIGFFLFFALLITKLNKKIYLHIALCIFLIYGLIISYLTFERSNVFANSKALWTDVLSKTSNNSYALSMRGNYYKSKNFFAEALKDYDQSLRLNKNNFLAYYQRSQIFSNQGQIKKALEDLDKAINLKPNLYYLYNNRGAIKKSSKDLSGAYADFSQALKIQANLASFINRASLNIDLNNFTQALQDLKEAEHFQSNISLIHFYKGIALVNLNKKKQGCRHLIKANEMNIKKVKYFLQKFCN